MITGSHTPKFPRFTYCIYKKPQVLSLFYQAQPTYAQHMWITFSTLKISVFIST